MNRFTHFICLLSCFGCNVFSKTIFLEMEPPGNEEITFLKKYGYLSNESVDGDSSYTAYSIAGALRKMQTFAGLPPTGLLDPPTKQLFKTKRCGVKDISNNSTLARSRRYLIQQGWTKRSITYKVVNGSSTLGKTRVEALIAEGLAVWAPHGGLQFTRLDDPAAHADITVYFARGNHGDGFAFDGQGHVVAHAFPPPRGDLHFDDDELWGDKLDSIEEDDDVTDFFAVAVHEIGHALGLSHSNVKASVMYPYYQVPLNNLHFDDIMGMQELYRKNQGGDTTESAVTLVPRFTKADSDEFDENYYPDVCLSNYDTLQVIHGKIYVFEEEWVWVLRDRNRMEKDYPKRIHDVFQGLPARINAVRTIYERFNGNVVIFSGRRYWEFNSSFRLVRRGNINDYAVPSNVVELTTVFISNYNNKTYLIEEERFWRYDESARRMDRGYPKEMSAWRQVPYPVDAALVWQGDTYFFQGPRFWRFDNVIVAAHEYYPLPVAQIWFGCPSTPEMDSYVINDGP